MAPVQRDKAEPPLHLGLLFHHELSGAPCASALRQGRQMCKVMQVGIGICSESLSQGVLGCNARSILFSSVEIS